MHHMSRLLQLIRQQWEIFHVLVGPAQPLPLPYVPHVDAMQAIPPADGKESGWKNK